MFIYHFRRKDTTHRLLMHILTLLVICSTISVASAQTCLLYRRDGPAECDSLATLPSGAIDFKATVWVPANVTYVSIINSLVQNIREAQIAPGSCKQATFNFVCPSFRQPCFNESGTPIPFPRGTCRSVCKKFVDECGSLIQTSGRQPPDCNGATQNAFGVPYPTFPDGGYNVTWNNQTFFVPCNDNDGRNANAGYADPPFDYDSFYGNLTGYGEGTVVDNSADCPAPNVNDNGTCWCCGCPDPMYTPTEYLVTTTFYYLGGWLSFIALGLYCGTYIIQYCTTKKVKKFPYNMPFFWGWGELLIAIAVILESFVGNDKVWCKGKQFASGHVGDANFNGMCLFQAIVYHYFIWYQLFWGIALNFTLTYKFVTLRDTMKYHQKWFHLIITPACSFSLIAAAATGRIGYARGTNLCFITEDFSNPDLLFYVKYIYVVPAVVVCIVLLGGVLANFVLVRRISSSVGSTGGARARQGEMRLLFFLLVLVALVTPNLVRFFISSAQQGEFTQQYARWVLCWADSRNGGSALLCGATPEGRPHVVWFFFSALTSSCHGFIVWLVLGLYRDIWSFWASRWCPWTLGKNSRSTAATRLK